MSSFKRINPADQFQDTLVANKQWSGVYDLYPYSDDYIKCYTGQNIANFDISGPQDQGIYLKSEYDKINQLFYHNYTASLDTQQRIAYSTNYDSASIYRATSSYFVYNENPLFTTNFPTNPGDFIKTLYIDQNIYGNKILPGSMILSSSRFYILDDGNGNLYDFKYTLSGLSASYFSASYVDYNYIESINFPAGSGVFVGNIFYSFGLCVITDQVYQGYFPIDNSSISPTLWSTWSCPVWSSITPAVWTSAYLACTPPGEPLEIAFKNEYPIYENFIYCKTKAGEFNLTYNPSLSPGTGSQISDFATGSLESGSYFTPYATTIGIYNDVNELLMVAKLGQPIPISSYNDMTFIIRYDT